MPRKRRFDESPPGFKLIRSLTGHQGPVHWIAWSPNGQMLATGSNDRTIKLWSVETWRFQLDLVGHNGPVYNVAWSPDGRVLASASEDRTIRLWNVETGQLYSTLHGHESAVYSLAFSPDGQTLASGSRDRSVRLWDISTGRQRAAFAGHTDTVFSVAWSPDRRTLASSSADHTIRLWDRRTTQPLGELKAHFGPVYSIAWSRRGTLASGSGDHTIRLWDVSKGTTTHTLEGSTDAVCAVMFSFDGSLLASQVHDGTMWLWDIGTSEPIEILDQDLDDPPLVWLVPPLKNTAFHPSSYTLATLCANDRGVKVWDLRLDSLPKTARPPRNVRYANAKVVLVGEPSVGKTGLGNALMERPYEPTEPTHGRYVWSFETFEHDAEDHTVLRETLLWDLAGQPGYRVFHQLHLNEVAIALVLFDSQSEADPFKGLSYWARALDTATRGFPMTKFLIASKIDRGGVQVSDRRIQELMEQYGFKEFFRTSARRGDGIAELAHAIRTLIPWEHIEIVSTPDLFHNIKRFLLDEKASGRILQPRGNLLKKYREQRPGVEVPPRVFDFCLGQLEAVGVIRRLSFRDLILLQPEILDSYCAWLAQAAMHEPDGLGAIPEATASAGNFAKDEDRLLAKSQYPVLESYIILATIQEVLDRGIVFREETERGVMLVFPSETRADIPEYPGDYLREVAFTFEGPVSVIYATLAVRLLNSREFKKKALYKNAAVFLGERDRVCGFAVDYPNPHNDGQGRLTVFFEQGTEKDIKLFLLRYVSSQLEKHALKDSVRRERIYQCGCGYTIPDDAVRLRKERKETTAVCPVCVCTLPIDDLAEQSAQSDKRIPAFDAEVDAEQQRQKRTLILAERERNREYHVFLCHNQRDRQGVRALADKLREQGLLPWLDEEGWLLRPNYAENQELKTLAHKTAVMAVAIGAHATGRPRDQEYFTPLQRFRELSKQTGELRVRRPIFLVFLPDVPAQPERLAAELQTQPGVDFRQPGGLENPDQLRRLIRVILEP